MRQPVGGGAGLAEKPDRRSGPVAVTCLALAALVLLAACAGGPFKDSRLDDALAIGGAAGLKPSWVRDGPLPLLVQSRIGREGEPVRIYIEGDGFAYATRGRPAIDPTPHDPVALRLAAADPAANVTWIARPCQYVMVARIQRDCPQRYWTTHRMAAEVVESLDAAVSAVSGMTARGGIELVGYSGGGAAAVLLAARRTDVTSLRTVAGNLDAAAFTRHHRVSPMRGSLDAIDVADQVRHVPQLHFVGAKDKIVPPALSRNFVQRTGANAKLVTVPNAEHGKGWVEIWTELLRMPFPGTAPANPPR